NERGFVIARGMFSPAEMDLLTRAMEEDPAVRGIYIYDARSKMLGNHVTNFPAVLGKGVYEIKVDEKCVFKDVIMGSNKSVVKLNCNNIKKKDD
ncbi:MAG: hypothetical protein J7501_17865, partial [Bdellovibrio sp.]|nr:hypothetical protein [Bdellovibrio sp.]